MVDGKREINLCGYLEAKTLEGLDESNQAYEKNKERLKKTHDLDPKNYFGEDSKKVLYDQNNNKPFIDDYICRASFYQIIESDNGLKSKPFYTLPSDVYLRLRPKLKEIPYCEGTDKVDGQEQGQNPPIAPLELKQDFSQSFSDVSKIKPMQWSLQLYLSASTLELLYNYGFTYPDKNGGEGAYAFIASNKFCQIRDNDGSVFFADNGVRPERIKKFKEAMIKFLNPGDFPIELPEDYPGIKNRDFESIIREVLGKHEADDPLVKPDKEFWTQHHSLDLSLGDEILLRYLMEMNGDQYHWLEPLSKLNPKKLDDASKDKKINEDQESEDKPKSLENREKRRSYAISTSAIQYYGPHAASELIRIAEGAYGNVSEATTIRARLLANIILDLRAQQNQEISDKIIDPIPLNIETLAPALRTVFYDPKMDIVEKINDISLHDKNLYPKPLSKFSTQDLPSNTSPIADFIFRRISPLDYIGWDGLLFEDEIKLFYAIANWKGGLASKPTYTFKEVFGINPNEPNEDHFICDNPGAIKTGTSCNVRRSESWEGIIKTLKKIKANTKSPSQRIRLQEIIDEATKIEQLIVKNSDAIAFRTALRTAIIGGVIATGVAVWRNLSKRALKHAPKPLSAPEPKPPLAFDGHESRPNDDLFTRSRHDGEFQSDIGDEAAAKETPNKNPQPETTKNPHKARPSEVIGEDKIEVEPSPERRSGQFRPDLIPMLRPNDVANLGRVGLFGVGAYGIYQLRNASYGPVLGAGLIYFGSTSTSQAADPQNTKATALEGDYIINEDLCVEEYAQNPSGRQVKFNTGYCGMDQVKEYLQERGDAENLSKIEAAEEWVGQKISETAELLSR